MSGHSFNIMAFPAGPLCNLDCRYCYYLHKVNLYKEADSFLMSEGLLEEYIKQYIEAHPGPEIHFGWQGGEPTLRGLDFYRKVVGLQERHLPPGWRSHNNLQTNGMLLDEEWCCFLKESNFLVGISLDGPQELHDQCRVDKAGKGSHAAVVNAIRRLQKYDVDFNILCVVNSVNSQYPKEVYRSFKELGAEFVQFIPFVESGHRSVTELTVCQGDYASFLIGVFNEWLRDDIGRVFIQLFEECLNLWAGNEASLCVFSEICGNAMVMEHNGDLYPCDHFVTLEYKLGNIHNTPIQQLVNSQQQRAFGNMKQLGLAEQCLSCNVKLLCQGECPKNRILTTENGERINYLCGDYKRFFNYITPFLSVIVCNLEEGRTLQTVQKELGVLFEEIWTVGRNDLCPCGSGEKFKKCCMDHVFE